MGIGEIEFKLKRELETKIKDERQVVFILSRIRKYIESKGLQNSFPILNMFCNWSLHIQIDNTSPIEEYFDSILNGSCNVNALIEIFKLDFLEFLSEYKLPILDKDNMSSFEYFLLEICSSTPLILKRIEKTKVIIQKDNKEEFIFIIN